jgi:hypothetical protein
MALSGCSNVEIASALGCSDEHIRTRFLEVLAKARSTRRWRLRKMQNKAASRGNVQMLIWLGKNELEQSDRQIHEHEGSVDFTLDLGQKLRVTSHSENGNGNGHRIT